MNDQIKVKKNIFIIMVIVLFLGIAIETTRSQFILLVGNQTNTGTDFKQNPVIDGISKEDLQKLKLEKYLIVYDANDEGSQQIRDNVKQVLDYMKKSYDVQDVSQFEQFQANYQTIIITVENLSKFHDRNLLVDYVEKGGSVFFTRTPEYNDGLYEIYRKLGIHAMNGPIVTHGIQMTSNLLIQGKDAQILDRALSNTSIPVELDSASTVYAVASNRVPLLWSMPHGNGIFMVYNGTNLHASMNRGIIAGAISLASTDSMYPIMNLKVAYIDDFPAPFRQGIEPNIYRDYKKDIPDFYRDIWWPDMIKVAADYDVMYTGAIIESYNDRVQVPFEDREGSDKNNLITYGRDLLKLGGELGIHGYNHQSLVLDQAQVDELGYNAWPNQESMKAALKEVTTFIKQSYPKYSVKVYVPPSNVLSEEGRQALKSELPEIKMIASLYAESANNKEYTQEFSVAPDGMLEMPRITSGYADTEITDWYIANAMTSIGVFSHFVHPDDILDSGRSKDKTWPVLSKEYRKMMGKVYQNYPWLRSLTASGAGEKLREYVKAEVYLEHKDNRIFGYINNFSQDMYFVLRTKKQITGTKQCDVVNIDEGVYLVYTTSPKFEIGLEG